MKRSSTLLKNEKEKDKEKDKENEVLLKNKKVYLSSDVNENDAPYYDPLDVHIHKWVIGFMNNPQNHHEQVVQMNSRYSYNREVNYCAICHEINYENPFPIRNNVSVVDKKFNDSSEKNLFEKEIKKDYNVVSKENQLKYSNMKKGQKKNEKILFDDLFMNNKNENENDWVRLV